MRKRALALCFALCLVVFFMGDTENTGFFAESTSLSMENARKDKYGKAMGQALLQLEKYDASYPVDMGFLVWACENVTPDFAAKLAESRPESFLYSEPFYELFGETLHVLWDRYTGALENDPYIHDTSTVGTVTLAFAGDVNLADDWENMLAYNARPEGVEDAISADLLQRMRDADIFLVNNEFCFSDRGSPMRGKLHTFRSATQNVGLLHEIGVDIVSLANNHVYDYGDEAFFDTLETLAGAGIPYVGAGRDISEAMQAQYFHAGGMKIAYVAASRAEKYVVTPRAAVGTPGVLWCYEEEELLEAIAVARQNADWVIVYPHWGTEYEAQPEQAQVSLAHKLVDAGADIVVGAHPHVLQSIEFYRDQPIAYSLGNFWFNVGWVKTALLEIDLFAPGSYQMRVYPCQTAGGTVSLMGEAEGNALLRMLESISEDIVIDSNGVVTST